MKRKVFGMFLCDTQSMVYRTGIFSPDKWAALTLSCSQLLYILYGSMIRTKGFEATVEPWYWLLFSRHFNSLKVRLQLYFFYTYFFVHAFFAKKIVHWLSLSCKNLST